MIYVISYDLKKPGRDYSSLFAALKSFPTWWHYLESTWLVSTRESAQSIYTKLVQSIDPNDRLLIILAGRDRFGWLPKEAWDWIDQNSA